MLLVRLQKWGLSSRKAALQGQPWVLLITGNTYIPAFLQLFASHSKRTQGSHVPVSAGQTPWDAPRTLLGCTRSQLTAALPTVPSASSWQTPRSSVVPRAHLLLPLTPSLWPQENGNSVENIPGKSAPEANKHPLSGSVEMPCRLPGIIFTLEWFHQPLGSSSWFAVMKIKPKAKLKVQELLLEVWKNPRLLLLNASSCQWSHPLD